TAILTAFFLLSVLSPYSKAGDPPVLAIDVAAVRLRFFAESEKLYKLQWSTQFTNWTDLTAVVGNGAVTNILDWSDGQKRFYRVIQQGDLRDQLALHYPFNGNAHDESRSEEHT